MHFRLLVPSFVRFLNGIEGHTRSNWPSFRVFRSYSISTYTKDRTWAFSERDYNDLKLYHFGKDELVTVLVAFLARSKPTQITHWFPNLRDVEPAKWVDALTVASDSLGKKAFYGESTWNELMHIWAHANTTEDGDSFCRSVETAREIARAQYLDTAKNVASTSEWRKFGPNAPSVIQRVSDQIEQFTGMVEEFWKAIPECIWLLHKTRRLIGGSIVLPLTPSAYENLQRGSLNDHSINPEHDLQYPSRHLFVMGFSLLPEIPKPKRPRLRAAMQLRKIVQHFALLIGELSEKTPVRLLAAMGSPKGEQSVELLGFTPLNRKLCGTQCPLYEIVMPAPELTLADYSSPETTIATLVGNQWRLLRRNQRHRISERELKSDVADKTATEVVRLQTQ